MIGVCGYGMSGSGALTDLFKEFEGVKVIDKREFLLTYFPGGIEDLEFHLMNQKAKFYSSDIAIKNFINYTKSFCHNEKSFYYKLTDGKFNQLVDDYINNITQICYKGKWMYDDYIFDSIWDKIKYAICNRIPKLRKYVLRNIHFSIEPENFYDETSKFLKSIYNYDNCDDICIVDQAFPANNPINSMKLFGNDSKAIIVTRDPRDLYYVANKYTRNKQDWAPLDNINNFITFYKKQYKTKFKRKDILYINFEDLIFNYEKTVAKICNFCNIDIKNHKKKYMYFDPKKSLKNTQVYKKDKLYKKEMQIIEKEMKEYLYDFSKYNEIDYSNDIF